MQQLQHRDLVKVKPDATFGMLQCSTWSYSSLLERWVPETQSIFHLSPLHLKLVICTSDTSPIKLKTAAICCILCKLDLALGLLAKAQSTLSVCQSMDTLAPKSVATDKFPAQAKLTVRVVNKVLKCQWNPLQYIFYSALWTNSIKHSTQLWVI